MSFPVVAQARDSINQAYAALQNWNTNPANIPIPDVVDTKRSQLSNKQIAAQYQKSIEGNSGIDINKIPKMSTRDRIDFELPITDEKLSNEIIPENQKRQTYACWVGNWYFEAKEGVESGTHLEFNWIGNSKNRLACTGGTPQFIVCSDQYLGETLSPQWIHNDVILDYRNVTGLYNDYGWCLPMWKRIECPTPATEIDEINQQIDATIKQNSQVRIYLNETDLNNYLEFRNETGELENFNYILISDKPSTPEIPPAPENSTEKNPAPEKEPKSTKTITTAEIIIAWLFAVFGTGILGWSGMKLRSRCGNNHVASTTTTVPAHVISSVQTGLSTSPGNSAAPVSNSPTKTTTSAAAVGVSTPPTTTAANSSGTTAQQSSSSSDDDSSQVAIDIEYAKPAGYESD